MEVNKILHILRNPYGWSEEEQRCARLAAADEIEKLISMNETIIDNSAYWLLKEMQDE